MAMFLIAFGQYRGLGNVYEWIIYIEYWCINNSLLSKIQDYIFIVSVRIASLHGAL